MALQASRRVGTQFKLLDARRKHYTPHARRKLLDADILRMRRWAACEGWGMTRKAQANVIKASFPHLAFGTIYDVLSNETWFDPLYVPGKPDVEHWGALPLPVIALRMVTA